MLHIPPYFQNFYKFPLFLQHLYISSPYFRKIYIFWLNLRFLASPHIDRDAFMHHALHILDAPASVYELHFFPYMYLTFVMLILSKFQYKFRFFRNITKK